MDFTAGASLDINERLEREAARVPLLEMELLQARQQLSKKDNSAMNET